jgi:hypothetical protein
MCWDEGMRDGRNVGVDGLELYALRCMFVGNFVSLCISTHLEIHDTLDTIRLYLR